MNKEEIKELKENKDIKYIYKIPCSLFETDLLVIIGNIKTKYDKEKHCLYFSFEDWFQRTNCGDLLPYVCSTLSKKGKIKEYLNVYVKPDLVKFRNYIIKDPSITPLEKYIEVNWALQILREFKVNRPDVFSKESNFEELMKNKYQKNLSTFLTEVHPMYIRQFYDKK